MKHFKIIILIILFLFNHKSYAEENIVEILKKNNNIIFSSDIGPGNCLIDKWIRANSKKNFDKDGLLAKSGKINKIILC